MLTKVTRLLEMIARIVRLAAYLLIDSLCFLVPRSGSETAVVVRLDAIGDLFVWLQGGAADIARYARDKGLRVVLIANCAWAELARTLGIWDEVVEVDPRRLMRQPIYRLRMFARIRRLGCELLVQSRNARVFLQEDALARVSGARTRIGTQGTLLNLTRFMRAWGNRYYDRLIDTGGDGEVHELIRNQRFVSEVTAGIGHGFDLVNIRAAVRHDKIVVAVGAGDPARVWPPERLAALIDHISSAGYFEVVLVGSPGDLPIATIIQDIVRKPVINKVGTTSLLQYVQEISSARVLVCNESSAFHIAMALGIPVLSFLGGGHFGRFAPYPAGTARLSAAAQVLYTRMPCFSCNWNCVFPRLNAREAFPCIGAISLESACRAFDLLVADSTGGTFDLGFQTSAEHNQVQLPLKVSPTRSDH